MSISVNIHLFITSLLLHNSSPRFHSPVVQQRQKPQISQFNLRESLEVRRRRSEAKNYLKWGVVNLIILALLSFNMWQTCIYKTDTLVYQVQYMLAVFVSLSFAACAGKYMWWFVFYSAPVCVTEQQRCLLDETNGKLLYLIQ